MNNKKCSNCVHWLGLNDIGYAACKYLGSDTEFDSCCDFFMRNYKKECKK